MSTLSTMSNCWQCQTVNNAKLSYKAFVLRGHHVHVHVHHIHVHDVRHVHVQWTLSTMSMSIRLRLRLMTLMVEVEVSLTDSVKVSLVELGYPLNSWEHTRLQTGWVLDGLDRVTNPHSVWSELIKTINLHWLFNARKKTFFLIRDVPLSRCSKI